ncbi:MAG: hypothetical protein NXI17_02920 [Alphaproteobacteria bacterium]|nr:hypothetical protein [Alphaproteobacteria bacterium]
MIIPTGIIQNPTIGKNPTTPNNINTTPRLTRANCDCGRLNDFPANFIEGTWHHLGWVATCPQIRIKQAHVKAKSNKQSRKRILRAIGSWQRPIPFV